MVKVTPELISKVLELNVKGMSYSDIKKELNLSSIRGVQVHIARNKIPFINNTTKKSSLIKKHISKSDYFSIIDTQAKAYILGFTYADGCVYNEGRFGYCLSMKDECILKFIRQEICPTALIKVIHYTKGALNRQPQGILRISDVLIVKDLVNKWGVVPNKTLNCKLVFPDLEESLMWSFICGLIDGDGSVRADKSKYSVQLCMTDIKFLEKLQEFLNKSDIEFKITEIQGITCKYYKLTCDKRLIALRFCEKMYTTHNSFCLERKKNKYLIMKENTVLNLENKKSKSM